VGAAPATDALKPELRSFNYDYDITKKYFSIIPTEARDARWKEILDGEIAINAPL
jgi:hypothetical protein